MSLVPQSISPIRSAAGLGIGVAIAMIIARREA
jgi:hypothetical protein